MKDFSVNFSIQSVFNDFIVNQKPVKLWWKHSQFPLLLKDFLSKWLRSNAGSGMINTLKKLCNIKSATLMVITVPKPVYEYSLGCHCLGTYWKFKIRLYFHINYCSKVLYKFFSSSEGWWNHIFGSGWLITERRKKTSKAEQR